MALARRLLGWACVATTVSKPPLGEAAGVRDRPVARSRTVDRTGPGWWQFARQLGEGFRDDNVIDVSAMLAYYAVLALFPMLVFVVTIALLVLDPATIQQGVLMATEAMPESARAFVAKQVTNLIDTAGPSFAIGGAVLALWGASRGAAALTTALNTIFDREETRGYLRRQVTALAVTLGLAGLIVAALGLLVVGPLIGHLLADRFGLGGTFDLVWGIGRWVGAGGLVMIVWGVVYRFLPDSDAPLRVFTWGSFVGVVAWLGISNLFGVYLAHFNSYEATYGALGGAIIFLTWLWLSSMSLLLGAEIDDTICRFRARAHATS